MTVPRLQKTLVFGLSLLMTILAIGGVVSMSFNTADDREYLYRELERTSQGQVLGTSTNKAAELYGCNEKKPIIGWIDFKGNKVIRDTLPSGQHASSCFATVQEANQAGFYFNGHN